MQVTKENINQVRIGGWAYHCCHEDLRQVDEELLREIKYDVEDPMLYFSYHDRKIDALTENFATLCRSHKGRGTNVDCEKDIKKLYRMICDELKIETK